MRLKPIDDGNSNFDLVVTRKLDGIRYSGNVQDEVTTIYPDEIRYVPYCKHHGAMLKVSEGGIWRCIRAPSLKTGKCMNDCRAGCIETNEGGIMVNEMSEISNKFIDHMADRWFKQNSNKLKNLYKQYLVNITKSSEFHPSQVETYEEFIKKEHGIVFKRECFRCEHVNTTIKLTHCENCGFALMKDLLVTELMFKLSKKQHRTMMGIIDQAYPNLESERTHSNEIPEVEDNADKKNTGTE